MFESPWTPQTGLARENGLKRPNARTSTLQHNSMYGSIGRKSMQFTGSMHAPPVPPQLPLSQPVQQSYHASSSWPSNDMSDHKDVLYWDTPSTFHTLSNSDESDSSNDQKATMRIRLPSDQMRQLITAVKENTFNDVEACIDTPHRPHTTDKSQAGSSSAQAQTWSAFARPATSTVALDTSVRSNRERNTSDITMHVACTGFPDCFVHDPVTGQMSHRTPVSQCRPVSAPTPFAEPAPNMLNSGRGGENEPVTHGVSTSDLGSLGRVDGVVRPAGHGSSEALGYRQGSRVSQATLASQGTVL